MLASISPYFYAMFNGTYAQMELFAQEGLGRSEMDDAMAHNKLRTDGWRQHVNKAVAWSASFPLLLYVLHPSPLSLLSTMGQWN